MIISQNLAIGFFDDSEYPRTRYPYLNLIEQKESFFLFVNNAENSVKGITKQITKSKGITNL